MNLPNYKVDLQSIWYTQMKPNESGCYISAFSVPLLELLPRILSSSDTIQSDKAACLVYLRMKHKDHQRGYVLCAVVRIFFLLLFSIIVPIIHAIADYLSVKQRTIVHNDVVGSVSYATERKALRNNATAKEVNIVSDNPEISELSFGVSILFFHRVML